MNPNTPQATVDTCALCPRLCRHVCPVAVGTGLESATPTAILTSIMMAKRNPSAQNHAAETIDLCTRCGHCQDFCGVDQPVVALLDAARSQIQPPPHRFVPPTIHGHTPTVAIICGAQDWSVALAEKTGQKLSTLRTNDHLGEAHRIRAHEAEAVTHVLATVFQGRTAISSCATCRQALIDADVSIETIESVRQDVPSLPTWRTCHCPAGPSVKTLLRCCGARAPLALSHPALSATMAEEIRLRLDGQAVYVPDTRCAAHLQSAGVQALGPADPFSTI